MPLISEIYPLLPNRLTDSILGKDTVETIDLDSTVNTFDLRQRYLNRAHAANLCSPRVDRPSSRSHKSGTFILGYACAFSGLRIRHRSHQNNLSYRPFFGKYLLSKMIESCAVNY